MNEIQREHRDKHPPPGGPVAQKCARGKTPEPLQPGLSAPIRAWLYRAIQLWTPRRMKRHLLFLRFMGRWGRFSKPRTYNEKINWRMLYDRRAELVWTCDKLEIKERAAAVGVLSPATYWSGDDVSSLAGAPLPDQWVLKPNHRAGLIYFGQGEADIDHLKKVTSGWIDEGQSRLLGEWAYSQARRVLLVEERLKPYGSTPNDYKFYVMHGETQLIQVDFDRFGDHRRNMYTPEWKLVDIDYHSIVGEDIPAPERLPEMLSSAERVAGDLDFLRVDLYYVDEEIYLGEVAAYAGNGTERWREHSFDLELGSRWTLPTSNR